MAQRSRLAESSTGVASSPQRFGTGTLLVEQRGKVLLVALSRPKVKNAFSDDMYRDLVGVLDHAKVKDDISAVVLTGDGPYFSSGADIKDFVNNFSPSETDEGRNSLKLPVGKFMMAMLQFPKVLAAAVNGPCIGIATTLLFHCDLCVCSPQATFWAPFTRLALVPEFCSSTTFQTSMGLAKANELLLLGRKIDAKTAVDWNICSRIVDQQSTSTASSPFHHASIASQLCIMLEKGLLSLPLGCATAEIFVQMVRGQRRASLQEVCRSELKRLDERFDRGDALEAAMHLSFGKKSKL